MWSLFESSLLVSIYESQQSIGVRRVHLQQQAVEEVRLGTKCIVSCSQLGPAAISTDDITAREADLLASPAADRVHWADCINFLFES